MPGEIHVGGQTPRSVRTDSSDLTVTIMSKAPAVVTELGQQTVQSGGLKQKLEK